jgi:hypothetical protein
MGDLRQLGISRRRLLVALAAALALMLAGAATAGAASLTVAPGASRKVAPCEVAMPCEFAWALEHATSGESVQFESGEYDFSGASNDDIVVHEKVKLEPAPGDTTRPLIKQTVAFPGCNCAMIGLETGDVIDGLAIDQAAADEGHDGGALELNQSDVVERSILSGAFNGLYYAGTSAPATGGLRDTLVIGRSGNAIREVASGITINLDNVTVIAHGSNPGQGIAIDLVDSFSGPNILNATNTIARGDLLDIQAEASGAGSVTANLHYSDARTALENTSGAATINDTDHPMHSDPEFVSATNFEEAPGSPTIDAGRYDATSGLLDLAGLSRVSGAATDIGAYEFHGTTPIVPPVILKKQLPPLPLSPVDAGLRLIPSRFRAASGGATISAAAARAHRHKARPPVGTTVSYTDSQAATTTFTVLQPARGVRSGKACVAPPRHRRRHHHYPTCTRYLPVRGFTFTHTDTAGADSFKFSARIGNRKLPPGAYRLTAAPRNSAGETGPAVSAPFTIVH